MRLLLLGMVAVLLLVVRVWRMVMGRGGCVGVVLTAGGTRPVLLRWQGWGRVMVI